MVDDPALDGKPQPGAVASRADGRPPTEASSDAPRQQAQVILEESEARVAAGAAKADAEPDPGVLLCGVALAQEDRSGGACILPEGHPGGHSGLTSAIGDD